MIRDIFKDEKYFRDFLQYESERIEKFNTAVNLVIEQRGLNDEGVERAYISLNGFYFNKLRALYSSGASLEEIKKFLPEVINIMEKNWNLESGYVQLVWILSIGIMLDIENEQFDRLLNLVEKQEVKDYLIDFLVRSKYGLEWEQKTNEFLHENPYGKLKGVIENSTSKSLSLDSLKEYLEKSWYIGHSDTGWYESHKSKNDVYSGYWSFESGAITKILQLDDSILKDAPYYPYDMVHYQEN